MRFSQPLSTSVRALTIRGGPFLSPSLSQVLKFIKDFKKDLGDTPLTEEAVKAQCWKVRSRFRGGPLSPRAAQTRGGRARDAARGLDT